MNERYHSAAYAIHHACGEEWLASLETMAKAVHQSGGEDLGFLLGHLYILKCLLSEIQGETTSAEAREVMEILKDVIDLFGTVFSAGPPGK